MKSLINPSTPEIACSENEFLFFDRMSSDSSKILLSVRNTHEIKDQQCKLVVNFAIPLEVKVKEKQETLFFITAHRLEKNLQNIWCLPGSIENKKIIPETHPNKEVISFLEASHDAISHLLSSSLESYMSERTSAGKEWLFRLSKSSFITVPKEDFTGPIEILNIPSTNKENIIILRYNNKSDVPNEYMYPIEGGPQFHTYAVLSTLINSLSDIHKLEHISIKSLSDTSKVESKSLYEEKDYGSYIAEPLIHEKNFLQDYYIFINLLHGEKDSQTAVFFKEKVQQAEKKCNRVLIDKDFIIKRDTSVKYNEMQGSFYIFLQAQCKEGSSKLDGCNTKGELFCLSAEELGCVIALNLKMNVNNKIWIDISDPNAGVAKRAEGSQLYSSPSFIDYLKNVLNKHKFTDITITANNHFLWKEVGALQLLASKEQNKNVNFMQGIR